MSNNFKNAIIPLGITDTDIYTCPGATESIVFRLLISNTEGIEPVNVTIKVYDDSGSVLRTISGKDTPVPVGSALDYGKIVLETGDVLRGIASKVDALEAAASILEIT